MRTKQQQKNDILASNLLFVFWAFSLMVELVRTKVIHAAEMSSPIAIVVIYLAYFGLYYAIRIGRRGAKVLLAIIFVVTIGTGVLKEVSGYALMDALQSQDYLYLVNFVLSYAIPAWALSLVFKKSQPVAII